MFVKIQSCSAILKHLVPFSRLLELRLYSMSDIPYTQNDTERLQKRLRSERYALPSYKRDNKYEHMFYSPAGFYYSEFPGHYHFESLSRYPLEFPLYFQVKTANNRVAVEVSIPRAGQVLNLLILLSILMSGLVLSIRGAEPGYAAGFLLLVLFYTDYKLYLLQWHMQQLYKLLL